MGKESLLTLADFFGTVTAGSGDRQQESPRKKVKVDSGDQVEKEELKNTPKVDKTTSTFQPDLITGKWELHGSILKRRYNGKRGKMTGRGPQLVVESFDLDSTLVHCKTSVPFPRNADDWKWFSGRAKERLLSLSTEKKTVIVIFSNQGGVVEGGKRYGTFTGRVDNILKDLGDAEVWVYAAIKNKAAAKEKREDENRKPTTGMWKEFERDLSQLLDATVDISASVFVGDAAGRKGDHSDSDKVFAEKVGLRFEVPEDYFEQVKNE